METLKEEDEDFEESFPPEVQDVLEEYKDIMPIELHKKLPPKKEMDHKIELELGAKWRAFVPYRMAPPKLA